FSRDRGQCNLARTAARAGVRARARDGFRGQRRSTAPQNPLSSQTLTAMAAESARKFEALEAQATALLDVFKRAGYEQVAPSIIQPADIFLDQIGEQVRSRTYVFTDLAGHELCLRPDLTVPVSRLYLERYHDASTPARFCYNGPAFRFQPDRNNQAH